METVSEVLNDTTAKIAKSFDALKAQFAGLRTGKASPALVDGIKVDYYDAKRKVIHEIKKSDKVERAHEWQLKYYLYVFERNGIEGVSGILEYPKLRKTSEVLLSDVDRETIAEMELKIKEIIGDDTCPPLEKKGICRNCSYYDFCYAGEEDEK